MTSYGKIDLASTIKKTIINLSPPPVVYTTLVALGPNDYAAPPGGFLPLNPVGPATATTGSFGRG